MKASHAPAVSCLPLSPGDPDHPPPSDRIALHKTARHSPTSASPGGTDALSTTIHNGHGYSSSAGAGVSSPSSATSTTAAVTIVPVHAAAQQHGTMPVMIASHAVRQRPISVAAPRHRARAAAPKRASIPASATSVSSPEDSIKDSPDSPASSPSDGGGGPGTRHHHHPDVWESHKVLIREIYINDNKPLKELMAVLREKGFKAT